MTYEEAIDFWYGRIDFERRPPKPGDLKLGRMRELLRRLGDPHAGLAIVHVAGTKGKGSTSAMVAAVLASAGYRTGLFTSPHLSHVEERVRIDGEPIGRDALVARMAEIAPAARDLLAPGDPERAPTFFEVGTALAFLHFARAGVDVAVVEVGLGGRFDSTNVCSPRVSVITSVSIDHTVQLGPDVSSIAREKAGIIKPGVPVVCTATDPEAVAVIEAVARDRGSPLDRLGRDFRCDYEPGRVSTRDPDADRRPAVCVKTSRALWPCLELGLLGSHQAENAAGVVRVVERLREAGIAISDAAVAEGLRRVNWPARLELVRRRPTVLLDCAHNVGSVTALVNAIREDFEVAGRKTLVFAASRDKDRAGMAAVLKAYFDRVIVTTFADNPRAATPEELAALFEGVPVVIRDRSADACGEALATSEPGDLIVIAGSVFLAGELRPLLVPA